GVWKTTNAGTTFTPIFDAQGSYSIGCLALDPKNPSVLWVGTGENNSQRSVGFGDGLYKSLDGGKSFTHVGLKDSEHIGMIAIDPRDSNTVYVAAQGPLWRSGGDRGLYKTTDGGATWNRILHISDDTGINEVHLDPRNPDTIYCSAYQRRRHVWTLINGGPESAIYKSTDAGKSFRKITSGLPSVDMGRIGMDISPANPDIVYAIIEAAEDASGFYRSTDRGETWSKRSSYVSSSPQYYQEIVADPKNPDRVYSLDTFLHVTNDGGATFSPANIRDKHVDDHALWINPEDTDHLLIGSDGGLYESRDRTESWRYFPNLPLTQFYKVAVDNSEPFYYVYGGTQDNNTQGGPARTNDLAGITNDDWFITVGGDGFEPAVDPEDPNIVYSQWQYGGLVRFDRASAEIVDIRPRENPGEEPYVFNWDSPLMISPHSHTRLYYGGDRLFRSEDRGNSWTAITGDLSRGIDRNTLEVMGRIQPPDAVAKHNSTSIYGNTVSLAESPLVEGLLYVGTDDGLIHVSEDNGATWRKEGLFPGVPDMTYVAYLTASQHDENTVYACFNNHKNGDFKPYILMSTDRGESWESITGDLPDRHPVYALQQDHEDPDLLFTGTEFGAFFTLDHGKHWHKIGGIPTIAIRDLEIQRRENDLVMASFGRGFYILDDYTPLRHVTHDMLDQPAAMFPIKDAPLYIETSRLGMATGRGFQGDQYYAAPNPPYGAVFTYHLKEKPMTLREKRKEAEKKGTVSYPDDYPTVDEFRAEDREVAPKVILTIRDDAGEVVRRIEAPRSEGMKRATWDLRYPESTPTSLRPRTPSPWAPSGGGPLALPGTYTVALAVERDGAVEQLTSPEPFDIVPLNLATLPAEDRAEALAFQRKVARLQRAVRGALRAAGEADDRLSHIRQAILDTPDASMNLLNRTHALQKQLEDIQIALRGDPTLGRQNLPSPPTIYRRVETIIGNQWYTTNAPTQTERDAYQYAADAFSPVLADLTTLIKTNLPAIEDELEQAGAPWTPGRVPTWSPE
ncbi:MAG: glycosyl hydrolase, partial [Planctomycetota bacterium]|nr:glycosyl hydrolase [Planctomycetota bacterium]